MSLNDKYIIKGSTLSDIGDALRSSGFINPPKRIESAKVLSYSVSYYAGYSTFSQTVSASDFSFSGKTPTKAKIFYTGTGSPQCNNTSIKNSWSTALTYSFPLNLRQNSNSYSSPNGTIIIVPLISTDYIVQDSSITLPNNSYSWKEYTGAGKSVPNLIQVSDIAALLAAGKEYQIYTADSSVTTGENIHYIEYTGAGYGGFTMPENIDYSKMVFCQMNYSDSYNFTYVRDVMPYIANSDKTQIFFPCFYYQMGGFPSGSNVIKTRTLRNSSNPYVANGWYGIGYKNTNPTMLTIGGVQLTAVTESSITLNYRGGLGSTYNLNRSIAIFEK